MMILTVKTDNPQAEAGLYDDQTQLAYTTWQAHRELSNTIHTTIAELLSSVGKNWKDIEAIIYFKGPGSFTGLRIGAALVNALAESNRALIRNQNGEDWIKQGITALQNNQTNPVALPEYGSEPHTTVRKK